MKNLVGDVLRPVSSKLPLGLSLEGVTTLALAAHLHWQQVPGSASVTV